MHNIPISIRLTEKNKQLIREYRQMRQLPDKTMAINQLLRMAELTVRYMQAGNGLLRGENWYIPPQDYTERTPIDEMTEQQREIFFKSMTMPSTKADSGGGLNELR